MATFDFSTEAIPEYCTQNDGRCETCSLSNYGRDCMNNKIIVKRKEVVNWDEARETGKPSTAPQGAHGA